MFDGLAMAVKELHELDPNDFTDGELSDSVVELQRQRASLEAAEARVVSVWNARRVWATDGARSGAAWLARKTRAPKVECGGRL